jgi:hypothetical protein
VRCLLTTAGRPSALHPWCFCKSSALPHLQQRKSPRGGKVTQRCLVVLPCGPAALQGSPEQFCNNHRVAHQAAGSRCELPPPTNWLTSQLVLQPNRAPGQPKCAAATPLQAKAAWTHSKLLQ